MEKRGELQCGPNVAHTLARIILLKSRNVSPDGNLEGMEPRLV